jgi:hypothetical protein
MKIQLRIQRTSTSQLCYEDNLYASNTPRVPHLWNCAMLYTEGKSCRDKSHIFLTFLESRQPLLIYPTRYVAKSFCLDALGLSHCDLANL